MHDADPPDRPEPSGSRNPLVRLLDLAIGLMVALMTGIIAALVRGIGQALGTVEEEPPGHPVPEGDRKAPPLDPVDDRPPREPPA